MSAFCLEMICCLLAVRMHVAAVVDRHVLRVAKSRSAVDIG